MKKLGELMRPDPMMTSNERTAGRITVTLIQCPVSTMDALAAALPIHEVTTVKLHTGLCWDADD